MQERPKIKPIPSASDKFVETLGWALIVLLWLAVIISFNSLPDTIPIHFDGTGKVDGYGSKYTIFLLPIIATVLFSGMSVLNNFPYILNYPVEITEENAAAQYNNAVKMIRYLKLSIVLVFIVITIETLLTVNRKSSSLGIWMLPLILAIVFIPLIYFIVKSIKKK
jgi:uncharacterized membrane protein